jgi:ABC-type lipoprotein export system ATPase subunit
MATKDTPLIEVRDLVKSYGNGPTVRALDGVSFAVQRGELVAVMGPSGCGKTTLLNIIGALDQPTSGSVLVAGQDLGGVRDLDRFRARTVGFVFQLHNLIPTLTAAENVEVPMRSLPMSGRQRSDRARELLEWVGMTHRADHFPAQLSAGERQRVAVARALANSPELILADEPTGNLDTVSGDDLIALLRQLNADHGVTILLVTHDRRVARSMHRVLTMQDGRLLSDHRVADPLTEDLRELAWSYLGQCLLNEDTGSLESLPFVSDGKLTRQGHDLARVLKELRAASRLED